MRFLSFVFATILISSTSYADQSQIPEPFRGELSNSPIEITYSDWSFILRKTVIGASRSSRSRAIRGTQGAPTGSRLSFSNKSDTRNDGNRINLKTLAVEVNLAELTRIRKSLEQVPSEAPMKYWRKKEQLAYWLNLYNVTLVEQLAKEYPFRKLKKLKKSNDSFWTRKLLNVAGVPLSLNDIQHTILPNKWDSTLFMYGLYQGYIGGPRIPKTAFTGTDVHYQLMSSGREFVNSNRGMKVSGKILKVSEFYKENAVLFPDWKNDVQKHVGLFADDNRKIAVLNASRVEILRMDYFTTDLYAGGRTDIIPQSNNPAGFLYSASHAPTGPGGTINSNGGTSMLSVTQQKLGDAKWARLPAASREYLLNMYKQNTKREGGVRIEKVEEKVKKDGAAQ